MKRTTVNAIRIMTGDRLDFSRQFSGGACEGAVFDTRGRLVKEFSGTRGIHIGKGVYIVHVKAILN